MEIKDGKIVKITETELFDLYLKREMDDIMDFNEYKRRFVASGGEVTSDE